MRGVITTGLSAILGCAGGCVSLEPDYRVDAVVFDPGAVGTWKQISPPPEKDGPDERVRIERREVMVAAGRLLGREHAGGRKTTQAAPVEAYTVTLTSGGSSEEVALLGYLVRAGEQTFAGVQVGEEKEISAQSRTHIVTVPMHMLMLYERTGDTLTLRSPKTPIVWAPLLRPLDGAEPTDGTLPPLPRDERVGVLFTPSIDRLVEAYAGCGSDPEFWREPTVYQRVRE